MDTKPFALTRKARPRSPGSSADRGCFSELLAIAASGVIFRNRRAALWQRAGSGPGSVTYGSLKK